MRIFLLVQNYYPNIQSCARIMHDLALVFRDQGHQIVLLAPDASLTSRRTVTEEDGITVVRVRSGQFRNTPRPLRAYYEWRLSYTIWGAARDFLIENPCDLIVSYAPTIFFGRLVARLKSLWNCPSYLILRDIFPQWCVEAGLMRNGGLAHGFFTHYENRLYRAVDVIGVESRGNLGYFDQRGHSVDVQVEVLYNWARSRGQQNSKTQMRSKLGLEGRVVFFYGGNLGVAQGAMCFVRLAETLQDDPRACFLFVGSGSELDVLQQTARERGIRNIQFLAAVDQATYLGLLSEVDVGLMSLSPRLKGHNFPGKMFDYLLLGKPILAAMNPGNELNGILEKNAAALVCVNGDDHKLLSLARQMIADQGLRHSLASNGRKLLRSFFSPERAAQQIVAATDLKTMSDIERPL